ncbi:uncharacterized protein LOC115680353 isoform X1 [Syzygium oleosum]|uniref:uncharacterized protein LOC115680353 isoform X1 n=1 Tax=Syzygium oleosum TaxID=219896 RepID=UPI0024B8E0DC|nr:uncharacterized protein LOC115680353 isoform X1 [Syzygium oleosum]
MANFPPLKHNRRSPHFLHYSRVVNLSLFRPLSLPFPSLPLWISVSPFPHLADHAQRKNGGTEAGLRVGAARAADTGGVPRLAAGHHLSKPKAHRHWPQRRVSPPDPLKNGVLTVQTIRNNIMASTLLATTAITLSSLISVFASSSSSSTATASQLVYGNQTAMITSIKYFAILVCFLVAFLCNVQSIRYYAHVSFLATLPTSQGKKDSIEYAARNLNRGSFFWSLGLRAFYVSFPLFLWIFGPIPMFVCCVMMSFVLYFLDTTTSFTRELHSHSLKEEIKPNDLESSVS